MKKFTLICLMLVAALCMQAADKNGRFFMRLNGQRVAVENVEANFNSWFNLPPLTEWRLVGRTTDYTGMERIEYRQWVDGVEVEHSQVLVHAKDGVVRSVNGMVMEARRTPAKVRANGATASEKPVVADDVQLLLVNTPQGFRYAYKVYSVVTREWVYTDCETGKVIMRVPTRHNLTAPTGQATKVTGKSLYYGDVELDVTKDADNRIFLYDPERNIHTMLGAYMTPVSELIANGTLYDYFPQGNLPDDPTEATEEQFQEWAEYIGELFNEDKLEHFGDYITDNVQYVVSNDGTFAANVLCSLKLTYIEDDDDEPQAAPGDDDLDEAENNTLMVRILYGATDDPDELSVGVIEDMELDVADLLNGIDLEILGEVIPSAGATLVLAKAPNFSPDDDDDFYYDDDDDDDDDELDYLAVVPIVPDESGMLAFENDRIAGSLTYKPWGDPAVDIHWGMARTLDFYKDRFNLNSYDDNGSPVYNLMYLPDDDNDYLLATPACNAAALAEQKPYPMIYGMGGADGGMTPVVDLSVMAHEYTHIITGRTSDLVYEGESGALNESFSDIMGVSVKKAVTGASDWYIGDKIMIINTNLRDMADPANCMDGDRPAPDTYQGENWVDVEEEEDNGGVHTNSSVQNKWYQLLVDGGTGTNDNEYEYEVEGIGLDKAVQIAYLTLTVYATKQSDYKAISEASMEATEVLYGENCDELTSVIHAWKAVGVIDPDEYETGITGIMADKRDADTGIYDLQGRRLSSMPTAAGIYIVNGKKVVVR